MAGHFASPVRAPTPRSARAPRAGGPAMRDMATPPRGKPARKVKPSLGHGAALV